MDKLTFSLSENDITLLDIYLKSDNFKQDINKFISENILKHYDCQHQTYYDEFIKSFDSDIVYKDDKIFSRIGYEFKKIQSVNDDMANIIYKFIIRECINIRETYSVKNKWYYTLLMGNLLMDTYTLTKMFIKSSDSKYIIVHAGGNHIRTYVDFFKYHSNTEFKKCEQIDRRCVKLDLSQLPL